MKIDFWPLGNGIDVKDINYSATATLFFVNIKFEQDGKTYRLVQQFFDAISLGEDLDDESTTAVSYSPVTFSVNSSDLRAADITNALVNFLAHHKLYLDHYSITKRETHVSYTRPEAGKTFDLEYEPTRREEDIYIDAEVQLEDGVDYYDLLDIRIREPKTTISGKEFKELGYSYQDYGVYSFAIIPDKNAEDY